MAGDVVPLVRRRSANDVESVLHDMRGPLTAIRGQCHAIVRHAHRPDELVERLRVIDREVDRLVESIELMRSSLRGVMRRAPAATVDLLDVVLDAARRHGGSAGEAGVSLHVEATGDRSRVTGCAEDLRRMADNLLCNALAHAAPGSAVVLTVTGTRDEVMLTVANQRPASDGPGPAVARGWGIGLAIVADIVVRHRGLLALDPAMGRTRVRVALPACDETGQVGSCRPC